MNQNDPAVEEFANNILKSLVDSVGYVTVITQLADLKRQDVVDAEQDGGLTPEFQKVNTDVCHFLKEAAHIARQDSEMLQDMLTS